MIAGITGIRGQDGSYLAQLLLEKGYTVIGLDRRSGNGEHYNWRHRELGIDNKFKIEYCDISEYEAVRNIIEKYQFDEFYNLAAESFVQTSFDHPFHVMNVNTIGVLNILESVRKYSKHTKVYQAGSSEQFGKVQEIPQTETTPFYPRSPYGISKTCAFDLIRNYRESYNMNCCSGILFNHESKLRGEEFVTRKITTNLAKWFYDNSHTFQLGNLDARRDWGFAGDYVLAQFLVLTNNPLYNDYVISSNETYSIREFIFNCCNYLNVDCYFEGKEENESVIIDGQKVITVSKEFYRPCEVSVLLGSSDKARKELGWLPNYTFKMLVDSMMQADIKRLEK